VGIELDQYGSQRVAIQIPADEIRPHPTIIPCGISQLMHGACLMYREKAFALVYRTSDQPSTDLSQESICSNHRISKQRTYPKRSVVLYNSTSYLIGIPM
jgi:hypothetical protein